MKRIFCSTILTIILTGIIISFTGFGCANIIPPGGGPRDSLPPHLMVATPKDSSLNFKETKITLEFDEYVQLDQNLNENLILSPTTNNLPMVSSRLKLVTIRIKDTLEANTTYSLNFGNAIKDVNEGTPFKNFTYVFATGQKLDENTFSGHVLLAQTGKVDSALIVVLHNNLSDTAIEKIRPRYFTKLDGKGNFQFRFLPKGRFNVFVIPNDYNKKYDDSTKVFAFLDAPVHIGDNTESAVLYAYQEAKEKPKTASTSSNQPKEKDKDKDKEDKRLKLTTSLAGNLQSILDNLDITFIRKLKTFDTSGFMLTDTNYSPIPGASFALDTGRTKVTLKYAWQENTHYKLLITKTAVADSGDIGLSKADTVNFITKKETDYGSLFLRFNTLDLSKNPVLQLIKGEDIFMAVPLTSKEWRQRLFEPGDYDLRILYDKNKNGIWDPGSYKLRKQPEIVLSLPKKLNIRSNWDNEDMINLTDEPD